jgi:nucleotide-binding universal stress UspA family protein
MSDQVSKTIVVGVDASEAARSALRWAVDLAEAGDQIEVVHAWNLNAVAGLEASYPNSTTFEVDATRLLHEAVASVVGPAPGDDITFVYSAVHGHPAEALIEKSARADLVVVGRRGLGGFKEMLVGSVSRDVVHHAECPVVVVPASG